MRALRLLTYVFALSAGSFGVVVFLGQSGGTVLPPRATAPAPSTAVAAVTPAGAMTAPAVAVPAPVRKGPAEALASPPSTVALRPSAPVSALPADPPRAPAAELPSAEPQGRGEILFGAPITTGSLAGDAAPLVAFAIRDAFRPDAAPAARGQDLANEPAPRRVTVPLPPARPADLSPAPRQQVLRDRSDRTDRSRPLLRPARIAEPEARVAIPVDAQAEWDGRARTAEPEAASPARGIVAFDLFGSAPAAPLPPRALSFSPTAP